jgi:hypothetical protein
MLSFAGPGRPRGMPVRAWSEQDAGTLMLVYCLYHQQKTGYVPWKRCYQTLVQRGITRSKHECIIKVKSLRRSFAKVYRSDDEEKKRNLENTCLYWEIMCKVWGPELY